MGLIAWLKGFDRVLCYLCLVTELWTLLNLDGVLVVKASKLSRGKRVLAALLRGGKVKGDTESRR